MKNNIKHQLNELSRPQLVALAVQKGLCTYDVALQKTTERLVAGLSEIEGVLVAEEA